jgi:predicted enzyme involved in methoxymalonyl-ACP biosynthesis
MSCRVLNRRVEQLTFNTLIKVARDNSCKSVVARFVPSGKNEMVRRLLPDLGFQLTSHEQGVDCYRYDVRQRTGSDEVLPFRIEGGSNARFPDQGKIADGF